MEKYYVFIKINYIHKILYFSYILINKNYYFLFIYLLIKPNLPTYLPTTTTAIVNFNVLDEKFYFSQMIKIIYFPRRFSPPSSSPFLLPPPFSSIHLFLLAYLFSSLTSLIFSLFLAPPATSYKGFDIARVLNDISLTK